MGSDFEVLSFLKMISMSESLGSLGGEWANSRKSGLEEAGRLELEWADLVFGERVGEDSEEERS